MILNMSKNEDAESNKNEGFFTQKKDCRSSQILSLQNLFKVFGISDNSKKNCKPDVQMSAE